MPSHPLLNDTHISVSSALATTIGLEPAILLSVLNVMAQTQTTDSVLVPHSWLRAQLPFWNDDTIRQQLIALSQQGLITLAPPIFPQGQALSVLFSTEHAPAAQAASAHSSNTSKVNPLDGWSPAENVFERLSQHGIDRSFALAQIDAFVLQGNEQGRQRNDWNTRFFRFVKQQWLNSQRSASPVQESRLEPWERSGFAPQQHSAQTMNQQWQPSQEAMQILLGAGVSEEFIRASVSEFTLYWMERGEAHKTWNSKFIQHIRTQWSRIEATGEHALKPKPITSDWQPSPDCFDILAMAYIDRQFAQSLVGEFVLYWKDSGQVHTSWNTRFLHYVKQRWGKRLPQADKALGGHDEQRPDQPSYTTAQASLQRLSDTSWAD